MAPPSSRRRARYREGGFDLDLCYIANNLIVSGNFYQGDCLTEFRNFLNDRHSQHYLIFNLCSEAEFNIEQDVDHVRSFPFNPCNPCALSNISLFCKNVSSFLKENEKNTAIIHCRTGKGRSCLMAACYLLYSGVCTSAEEAVVLVNKLRCPRALNALVIPSQVRYVHYFAQILQSSEQLDSATYRVDFVRMTTCPRFNSSLIRSGCTPELSISVLACGDNKNTAVAPAVALGNNNWYPRRMFSHLDHIAISDLEFMSADSVRYVDMYLEDYSVLVRGDTCLTLFSGQEKMCQVWFHTSFVEDGYVRWEKEQIDLACRDVKEYTFEPGFRLELYLQRVDDVPTLNIIPQPRSIAKAGMTGAPAAAAREETDEPSAAEAEKIQFMYAYGDTNIAESDDDDF